MGGSARTSTPDLTTIRLLWQQGDWDALAALRLPDPRGARGDPVLVEMLCYQAQAAFQTGQPETGRKIIETLRASGVARGPLLASLLSGAMTNVSRAWQLMGNSERCSDMLREAVALNPNGGDPELVRALRMERERRRLIAQDRLVPEHRAEGLFIDCGGYDGCSALAFLLQHPGYDCVTFEPNPDLWRHYPGLPTTLIGKAAWIEDGEVDFTIDPIDADGSTLIPEKRVDFNGTIDNENCPHILVPCVDLSDYVRAAAERYSKISLKLDIEGAEYAILEKMISEGTISLIETLYCEFHGAKMGVPQDQHDALVASLEKLVPVKRWDAAPLSVIATDTPGLRKKRRAMLLAAVEHYRKEFSES